MRMDEIKQKNRGVRIRNAQNNKTNKHESKSRILRN